MLSICVLNVSLLSSVIPRSLTSLLSSIVPRRPLWGEWTISNVWSSLVSAGQVNLTDLFNFHMLVFKVEDDSCGIT